MQIDNTNNTTQRITYTLIGCGVGAAAGWAGDRIAKPLFKDDAITDSFVKKVTERENKLNENDFKVFVDDLKKISDSGELKNTQEFTKAYFADLTTTDEIKTLGNKMLDDLKAEFGDGIVDGNFDDYRAKAGVSPENLPLQKERIKSAIDFKNKTVKKLSENADLSDKNLFEALKKTIFETKLKSAGKSAAIVAIILGAAGYGLSLLTGNKNK